MIVHVDNVIIISKNVKNIESLLPLFENGTPINLGETPSKICRNFSLPMMVTSKYSSECALRKLKRVGTSVSLVSSIASCRPSISPRKSIKSVEIRKILL